MRRGSKPAKSNEAQPPVARDSPKGNARVRDLEKRLAEALEQQRASGEILRAISSSPTNLQPVLDAIATNAALVCDAYDAVVFLREGDRLRAAAHYGPITITLQHSTLSRGSVTEAAILDRQRVHVHDVLTTEPLAFPLTAEAAREGGFRTVLSVPLLRENEAIGALAIRRREVQPFTTQQIALVETFADQAVIAIENVGLFKELEARNRDLTESLEQQIATAEILRLISSSPTAVQPTFEAIARAASTLCEADFGSLFPFDGEFIHLGTLYGRTPEEIEAVRGAFPQRPSRSSVTARAILAGSVVQIADVSADPEIAEALRTFRTVLAVPLLRDGRPLGAITVARRVVRPFSDNQIALLKTFADQAVIAIENVRLFTELQEKNLALTQAHSQVTEALEQQTATSEILEVISAAQTDIRPVFDTIAKNARRLCEAGGAQVVTYDGELMHLESIDNVSPEGTDTLRGAFPMTPSLGSASGRAIL